jgi:hypothetical protein
MTWRLGNHDKAFKALMKEPGALEALLRERLPRALVRRFAGPPTRLSESFVEPALRETIADLVVRVPLKGGDAAFVYCVVEHKRTPDRRVLLQVLRSMTGLYAKAKWVRGKLPPVVSLVEGPIQVQQVGPSTPLRVNAGSHSARNGVGLPRGAAGPGGAVDAPTIEAVFTPPSHQ